MGNSPERGMRESGRVRSTSSADATYWDIDDIQFHCRLSRTSAWDLARRHHDFPPPVVLGKKSVVWPRAEVVAFMEAHRRRDHYSDDNGRPATPSGNHRAAFASRPIRVTTGSPRQRE
jgi:predicted DNA-binding transcriptional regulator AlpA